MEKKNKAWSCGVRTEDTYSSIQNFPVLQPNKNDKVVLKHYSLWHTLYQASFCVLFLQASITELNFEQSKNSC